jgi:hypothetical protein
MRNHWLGKLIPAIALATLPVLPTVSHAGVVVGVSINIAPPVLPVYVQPPLPAPGYMWTPGYWAYGDDGYYWVPGTWVLPPTPGFLWTPGYWGWAGGVYSWHGGYWGPHIGFYGGVNYGFGYTGVGFSGGYWRGGAFFYNRSVANFGSVHVTNVYNKTVINNVNHVAFNGGPGGLQAHATARELAAEHDHHVEATAAQRDHEHLASTNRDLRASVNHGRPAVAATSKPGQFSGRGVVGARGSSGPHGGAVAHNGGPANHGGGPQGHGGPAPGGHGAPGGGEHSQQLAHNESHPGGGSPGGGHPNNSGGGHPNPGGGHPNNAGGGHPNAGGGHPNPGGGHPAGGGGHPQNHGGGSPHKPEGHR